MSVLLFSGCGKGIGEDRILPVPVSVVVSTEAEPLRPAWVAGANGELLYTMGIATGNTNLWYRRDNSYVSLPEAPGGISAVSLQVIQRDGVLHSILVDRKHYDIYYGTGTTAARSWRDVYPGLNRVGAARLLFDPLANPWIFFADETSGALMALKGAVGSQDFVVEKVASGLASSIAAGFDPSGKLFVVWSRMDSTPSLQLSIRADGRWETATLDDRPSKAVTLNMGPPGDLFLAHPRVAWQLADSGELMYAELLSGGWHIEQVEGGGRVGADPTMLVDPLGGVWLCSTDQDRLDLIGLRQYPDGGWRSSRLAVRGATGFWPDLISREGKMVVLFWDDSTKAVQTVVWGEF